MQLSDRQGLTADERPAEVAPVPLAARRSPLVVPDAGRPRHTGLPLMWLPEVWFPVGKDGQSEATYQAACRQSGNGLTEALYALGNAGSHVDRSV